MGTARSHSLFTTQSWDQKKKTHILRQPTHSLPSSWLVFGIRRRASEKQNKWRHLWERVQFLSLWGDGASSETPHMTDHELQSVHAVHVWGVRGAAISHHLPLWRTHATNPIQPHPSIRNVKLCQLLITFLQQADLGAISHEYSGTTYFYSSIARMWKLRVRVSWFYQIIWNNVLGQFWRMKKIFSRQLGESHAPQNCTLDHIVHLRIVLLQHFHC